MKIIVGAALLIAIAGCSSTDNTARDNAIKQRDAAVAQATKLEADLKVAQSNYDAQAELTRTAESRAKAAAAETTAAAYAERVKKVKARESAVAAREKAVTSAEAVQKRSTFDDGQYQVGVDIDPGTYHTDGATDCYWVINSDPNGNDIVANELGDGPMNVSVKVGQWLTVRDCGTWQRRG